ncbi:MAG TPA: hydrolase [Mariprofundaceae bacterium]|nr:hydrolase [Mariprofundaceae bacterium]
MRLECGCPTEFPAEWDGKDIDLGTALVHEQRVPMFLHMPIGFEACLDNQHKDIERLGLTERWPGFVLSESSMFRGRILCPLSEESSPARNVYRLPNPFHLRARLFRGDVGGIRLEVRNMQSSLLDEGKMPKQLFLCYLTCPRCQEERGGMQLMLLRHWIRSPKLEKRLARRNQLRAD